MLQKRVPQSPSRADKFILMLTPFRQSVFEA
jgi:hypothetical protein